MANAANAFGLGKVPKIPVANFSSIVSYLQSAGLLDMAYIYGYDEVSTQTDFDKIYYRMTRLRQGEAPGCAGAKHGWPRIRESKKECLPTDHTDGHR